MKLRDLTKGKVVLPFFLRPRYFPLLPSPTKRFVWRRSAGKGETQFVIMVKKRLLLFVLSKAVLFERTVLRMLCVPHR